MKIEINNKELENKLEQIALDKYITPEMMIAELLKEFVEDTVGYEIDTSIASIKKEAEKLSNEINTRLNLFEKRYEVNANIEQVAYSIGLGTPQRYSIRIIL